MSESWLEHLDKAWMEVKEDEAVKPLDKEMTSEFGCSVPLCFNTSDGIKTMEPGKRYDDNLNEIKECTCFNFYNSGNGVTCNCDVKNEK